MKFGWGSGVAPSGDSRGPPTPPPPFASRNRRRQRRRGGVGPRGGRSPPAAVATGDIRRCHGLKVGPFRRSNPPVRATGASMAGVKVGGGVGGHVESCGARPRCPEPEPEIALDRGAWVQFASFGLCWGAPVPEFSRSPKWKTEAEAGYEDVAPLFRLGWGPTRAPPRFRDRENLCDRSPPT